MSDFADPSGGTASATGSGGSSGTVCTARGDCSEDTECITYACEDGRCTSSFAPDGTDVPGSGAAGDCKKVVCIKGVTSTQADDTDFIADANVCTIESCNGMSKVTTLVDDGTPCGMPGQDLVCKSGKCVGCGSDPSKCPTSTDCVTWSCKNDVCESEINVGAEVSAGAPDDCKHDVCDAQGMIVVGANPAEDGAVCDSVADTCKENSTCLAGVCTLKPKPVGTDAGDDGTLGNCKKYVCDGTGDVMLANDDMDAVDNANDCVTPKCMNGTKMDSPVQDGQSCNVMGAGTCCAGACCGSDTPVCLNGACCAKACDTTCCMTKDAICNGTMCCESGKICGSACCPKPSDMCAGTTCCPAEDLCTNGTTTSCCTGKMCDKSSGTCM